MDKTTETGRSMIEMIGVLAITGVLSVGGFAGYTKAIERYRLGVAVDQISMLVARTKTFFGTQNNFNGLTTLIALQVGIIDHNYGTSSDSAVDEIKNVYGGAVNLRDSIARYDELVQYGNTAFTIRYDRLNHYACLSLASIDWGAASGSGIISVTVGLTTDIVSMDQKDSDFDKTYIDSALNCSDTISCNFKQTIPMSVAKANYLCRDCTQAQECSILLKFF